MANPVYAGKAERTRRVDNKAVPCPDCKAEVGQRCTKLDGTPMSDKGSGSVHRSRRRMAARAGAYFDPEKVEKQVDPNLPICPVCEHNVRLLHVTEDSIRRYRDFTDTPIKVGQVLAGSHTPTGGIAKGVNKVRCPGSYEPIPQ